MCIKTMSNLYTSVSTVRVMVKQLYTVPTRFNQCTNRVINYMVNVCDVGNMFPLKRACVPHRVTDIETD